ncbi:neutrophil cytosol factor 2-like [Entelurus aequoreus]|uniref:neutrophil cytosol factor 2-like n=1 Tax=Entelurus aequoreus TaxID=161455 RepID=UPI002B1D2250|nr:neutrophil cytosol factor 2-like [Entelurus aequoreus]
MSRHQDAPRIHDLYEKERTVKVTTFTTCSCSCSQWGLLDINRLEEALSDCVWAQKHLRGNNVIDYRQPGLHYKLNSWPVSHNAAAVYCQMDQWEQAKDVLMANNQGGNLEMALDMILVISSTIPNDDFGVFEPLRLQKPGFYQPSVDGAQHSRYMCMARGPGQLTVPGGAKVFIFGEEDRDGMATVIYDGQRGLVPASLLKPADIKTAEGKTANTLPTGIPLPPGLKPPTRPQTRSSSATPTWEHLISDTPPPPYATATRIQPSASTLPGYTANAASKQVCGLTVAADGSEDQLIYCFKKGQPCQAGREMLLRARQQAAAVVLEEEESDEEQQFLNELVIEKEDDDDEGGEGEEDDEWG